MAVDATPAVRGGARLHRLALRAWPYFVLVLAPIAVVAWIGGDGSWPAAHEGLRYPALAEFFGRAFANGQPWPRWLPEINGGYGYPTFVYYQPLLFFLWLPLRFLTGDPVLGMWALIAAMLAAGAIACHRLAARTGGTVLGLFAGLLFLLAPYVYVDWLVRGDLSELLALCLVPWALLFLRDAHAAWSAGAAVHARLAGFALATAAVFWAHPICGLLLAPNLVVIALALGIAPRPWRIDAGWLLRFAAAGLAAIGFAVPYAQPLLTLMHEAHLDAAAADYYSPVLHTVSWHQFLGGPWGFGVSVPAPAQDGMPFEVGRLQLLAALTGALVGWRQPFVRGLALALALSLVAMTPAAAALWTLPVFERMQFPWRLLSVVVGLEVALVVGWAEQARAVRDRRALALGLAIALAAAGWRPEQFDVHGRLRDASRTVTDAVRAAPASRETLTARNEFLPRTAASPPAVPLGDRALVETAAGAAFVPAPGHGFHRIAGDVVVTRATTVVINQLYFPGWSVSVAGRTIADAELRAALAADGRLRVRLDPADGRRQSLRAHYAGPPGGVARLGGVLFGVAMIAGLRRADRRRRPAAA